MLYSTLFAEAFPAGWESKGWARRVLNEFWKFGAMFIVLIYLCNLRSHLIKTTKVPLPNSVEEMALPKYSYKLLLPPYMTEPGMPDYIFSMERQGRLVKDLHGKKRNISLLKVSCRQTVKATLVYFSGQS